MKCVILGFGFLARYLLPCCEHLLGRCDGQTLAAVKGTPRDIEALRARYPFPVQAGGALEALRSLRPDVVLLCVKPHQVAAVLEDAVKPYLREMHAAGQALPDIYAFAAGLTPVDYLPLLGEDVNVACMTPNMLCAIEGRDVAPVGVCFVSFASGHVWPAQNRRRALAFLRPVGTVLEIAPEIVPDYIALNCSCHMMFEFNYIAQEALERAGRRVSLAQTSQGYRLAFRKIFDEPCAHLVECDEALWDAGTLAVMELFMRGWYEGLMAYCARAGVPREAAHRNACGSMEVFQMEVQLETRAQLEETTRLHATPGGFLEKAIATFAREGMACCQKIWRRALEGQTAPDALARVRSIAETVLESTARHGREMARRAGEQCAASAR